MAPNLYPKWNSGGVFLCGAKLIKTYLEENDLTGTTMLPFRAIYASQIGSTSGVTIPFIPFRVLEHIGPL